METSQIFENKERETGIRESVLTKISNKHLPIADSSIINNFKSTEQSYRLEVGFWSLW